jgi:hypothetical protein
MQQHERGGQDEAVHAEREQAGRRTVLAVCPAQAVDVGVRDDPAAKAATAQTTAAVVKRITRSPVPGHRPAPRLVAGAALLDAVRGRISEPSLKQHG